MLEQEFGFPTGSFSRYHQDRDPVEIDIEYDLVPNSRDDINEDYPEEYEDEEGGFGTGGDDFMLEDQDADADARMIMDGGNECLELTGEVNMSGDGEEMVIDANERDGDDDEGVVESSQRGVTDIVIGATVGVTLGAALGRFMGGQGGLRLLPESMPLWMFGRGN